MATCDSCGTTILFGGQRHAGLRFCGDACLEQGALQIEAAFR